MSESKREVTVGRYLAREQIGSGASGLVLRARDPLIGRDVALKIIRVDKLRASERLDYMVRFRIEAQAGGRCNHPAIVALYDAGEDDGVPYLVMEYVAGRSLAAILADPAARAALDPVAIMEDMLSALEYAHGQGILHRDIKPANIIVTPEGRAKVADFGIARLDGGQNTLLGELLGTPSYMSPEQANGEVPDQRSDLFSAAAIFHAMLTGVSPFAGRNITETLIRLSSLVEVDLSGLAGTNAKYYQVLRKALAKDPNARFGSAAEFAVALRTAVSRARVHSLAGGTAGGIVERERTNAPWVNTMERERTNAPWVSPPERERTNAPWVSPPARERTQAPWVGQAERIPGEDETSPRLGVPGASLPREVVAEATIRLAHYVGPMARLHARKAAEHAAGLEDFLRKLAQNIPNTADTAQFLSESRIILRPDAPERVSTDLSNVPPVALETMRLVLAETTGPIAKLLIARAMADAPGVEALVDRLLEAVPAAEKMRLRPRLWAALAS